MYAWKSFSKLQELKPYVPDLHPDSIEELQGAFDSFDTEGAGEISLGELVDSMESLGFHDKNPMMLEMILKMSARHKRGNVKFSRFVEDLADLIQNVHHEKDVRAIFDMLDEEYTGRIGLETFRKIAAEFGDESSDTELLEMLRTAKQPGVEGLCETQDLATEVSFHYFYHLMTKGNATIISSCPPMSPRGQRQGTPPAFGSRTSLVDEEAPLHRSPAHSPI